MNDVTRLFRALVNRLAAQGEHRLEASFQVSEIYQSLLPYRTHKRELGFDSVEDYEMAILRLVAGEENLATADPEDVRDVLRLELEAVSPDPGAFRDFAGARITLNRHVVQSVLQERTAYAPPIQDVAEDLEALSGTQRGQEPSEDLDGPGEPDWDGLSKLDRPSRVQGTSPHAVPSSPVFEAVDLPSACPDCRGSLPVQRTVRFCPFCGAPVAPGTCRQCGDPIDATWRYCVTCGTPSAG